MVYLKDSDRIELFSVSFSHDCILFVVYSKSSPNETAKLFVASVARALLGRVVWGLRMQNVTNSPIGFTLNK